MGFHVSFPAAKSAAPLDGRLLVMLSTDNAQEPRFQITGDANTQLVFGINVDGLKPGEAPSSIGRCWATRSRVSRTCRPASIGSRRCCTSTKRFI